MEIIELEDYASLYEELDYYLNKGFKLTKSNDLSVNLKKNNLEVKLVVKKYMDVELKRKKLIYPSYDDTLLNVISSIRDNFGYKTNRKCNLDVFDKKYSHVTLIILDGLGTHQLFNILPKDSFLRTHFIRSINSIYPSTTAAATTSVKTGLTPLETGWTGWENYIREINKNVVLFTGNDYQTDEKTSLSGYNILPIKPFFNDFSKDVSKQIIEPNFALETIKIKDCLKRSLLHVNNNEKTVEYLYHPQPDSIFHDTGNDSFMGHAIVHDLDEKIKKYCDELPKDSLVIISADHGHINCSPIDFYNIKVLYDMLKRNPSNDSRCLTFKVKDECMSKFEKYFNAAFKNIYKLYKTQDAIEKGFFGDGAMNERCIDFLADYVAIATNEYYFNYKKDNKHKMKSHHAGITKEEMEVPLIVFRK